MINLKVRASINKKEIDFTEPQMVEGLIVCKNPRCVTSVEPNVRHLFTVVDFKSGKYRCLYCDEIHSLQEV